MKRLLIVSPHFPPTNAPDMHRVRLSLPYFAEFGWQPLVLGVDANDVQQAQDPRLTATLPADLALVTVRALSARWSRLAGVGNPAIRAFGSLYLAGSRLIRRDGIDLVYFSTTQFLAMPLGRMFKARFGVPYVLDLQDPWFTTYYDDKPASERPPKHRVMRQLHRHLERWTMKRADGVIAVSRAYIDTLRGRYEWLTEEMCATVPFGAAEGDFGQVTGAEPLDGCRGVIEGVYIGRGGADMRTALTILFRALAAGRSRVELFRRVALSFNGTSYGNDPNSPKTVEPIAAAEGVGSQVTEQTARLPYFESLARLRAAAFLVLIGSDDPQYSASKIYSYILARRPILAITHERSPIADVIRRTRAGTVVTFADGRDIAGPAERLRGAWAELLAAGMPPPQTDWAAFEPYSARVLTGEQCRLFDAVVSRRTALAAIPCTD